MLTITVERDGQTWTRVTCDGGTPLLGECPREIAMPGSYLKFRKMMVTKGWIERQDDEEGRIFLCADCAGERKFKVNSELVV